MDSAFEVLGHSVSDEMVCLPVSIPVNNRESTLEKVRSDHIAELALGLDSPLVMELSARGVYTAFGREVLHQWKEQVFGIRLVP